MFLDETGTSLSLSPLRAWAPRGQRAIGAVPTGHRRPHTVLATLTSAGMGPTMLVEGPADRAVFETFVAEWLLPVLRPGQTVVLDNNSVHHSRRARDLIEQAGCQLLFLPTYSPDCNPIELAFAKLKSQLRRAAARSPDELERAVAGGLTTITAADARAFYQQAGYPLQEQLLCNPL
jgi:transposase